MATILGNSFAGILNITFPIGDMEIAKEKAMSLVDDVAADNFRATQFETYKRRCSVVPFERGTGEVGEFWNYDPSTAGRVLFFYDNLVKPSRRVPKCFKCKQPGELIFNRGIQVHEQCAKCRCGLSGVKICDECERVYPKIPYTDFVSKFIQSVADTRTVYVDDDVQRTVCETYGIKMADRHTAEVVVLLESERLTCYQLHEKKACFFGSPFFDGMDSFDLTPHCGDKRVCVNFDYVARDMFVLPAYEFPVSPVNTDMLHRYDTLVFDIDSCEGVANYFLRVDVANYFSKIFVGNDAEAWMITRGLKQGVRRGAMLMFTSSIDIPYMPGVTIYNTTLEREMLATTFQDLMPKMGLVTHFDLDRMGFAPYSHPAILEVTGHQEMAFNAHMTVGKTYILRQPHFLEFSVGVGYRSGIAGNVSIVPLDSQWTMVKPTRSGTLTFSCTCLHSSMLSASRHTHVFKCDDKVKDGLDLVMTKDTSNMPVCDMPYEMSFEEISTHMAGEKLLKSSYIGAMTRDFRLVRLAVGGRIWNGFSKHHPPVVVLKPDMIRSVHSSLHIMKEVLTDTHMMENLYRFKWLYPVFHGYTTTRLVTYSVPEARVNYRRLRACPTFFFRHTEPIKVSEDDFCQDGATAEEIACAQRKRDDVVKSTHLAAITKVLTNGIPMIMTSSLDEGIRDVDMFSSVDNALRFGDLLMFPTVDERMDEDAYTAEMPPLITVSENDDQGEMPVGGAT